MAAFYSEVHTALVELGLTPAEGSYRSELGEFLLPYEAVRAAEDPDLALLECLQTTYEAAADHGGWDRASLDDDPRRRATPR